MSCTPAERLRWIAEYLALAGKAVSVLACVNGIEYSPKTHLDAEQDLITLAEEFERATSAPKTRAEVSTVSLAFQANSMLERAIALLSELCEKSNAPAELLEVSRNIECALVRLGEWQQYFGSRSPKALSPRDDRHRWETDQHPITPHPLGIRELLITSGSVFQ